MTVDDVEVSEIVAAIRLVNKSEGLRTEPGEKAVWALYAAPEHTLPLAELDERIATFNAHFGWFCREVAELAGVEKPGTFALTNKSTRKGVTFLTLKPKVVEALRFIEQRKLAT